MKVVAAASALAILCACMGTPKQADDRSVYGAPPDESTFKKVVDAEIARSLKDPESRRIRFGTIAPYWVRVVRGFSQSDHFGYGFLLFVNAKNSYGGYTGEQPWMAMNDGSGTFHIWGPDLVLTSAFRCENPGWSMGGTQKGP